MTHTPLISPTNENTPATNKSNDNNNGDILTVESPTDSNIVTLPYSFVDNTIFMRCLNL